MNHSVNFEDVQKFKVCFCKISNLYKQQCKNYSVVYETLKILNTIKYETFSCDQEKQKCVYFLVNLVSSDEVELVDLISGVILKLLKSGLILNTDIIPWLSRALITWSTKYSIIPILSILEILMQQNVVVSMDQFNNILDGIKQYVFNNDIIDNISELFLHTLQLIQLLICVADISNNAVILQEIIFSIMKHNKIHDLDKLLTSQLLVLAIEIINTMCEKNSLWLADELGSVLGIALVYSSYGLRDNCTNLIPCLVPSPILSQGNHTREKKDNPKSKNRRKQKKNAIEKVKILKAATMEESILPELNWSQTSESDYSDTESGRNCRLRKFEKKVRIAALSLLLFVVRMTEKKKLIGYWNNILSGQHSIIDCLKMDYSPQCKVTITAIIMILFNNGKTYIAQAQHSVRTSTIAYTSWFDLLADLIFVVHRALVHLFTQSHSQSKIFISALLKCLTVVISSTPYSRLKKGLLTDVVSSISPLLTHSDHSIRIMVLKCLKEIIILEPQTSEQIQIIQSSDYSVNVNGPWITSYCYSLLRDEKYSILLKAECWITIGYIAKHHFETIPYEQLEDIMVRLLLNDLECSNVTVQQNALKALEYIAVPFSELNFGIDCVKLWHLLLNGPLVPLLQSTSGILVASACDCISNISSKIFEQLPEKMRIFVITVLFGCAMHENQLARAAAVRSLGVIISFPFLSRDIQIIYDASERVVQAMKDEHLTVRIKSAWAFGNVAEVLLQSRSDGVPVSEVPLLHLLEVGLKTGKDHEKVKTCSMRPMGYLLQLLEKTHLSNPYVVNLVNDIIDTLIVNATTEGNMKVRWNACYSIGNMFKNDELLSSEVKWKDRTLPAVSDLMVTCPNFKVRQSACNAISQLQNRHLYNPYFSNLWLALIEAIKNAQSLTDFSEYKHQRNLIEQLYSTFCHFITLSNEDDFDDHLYEAIHSYADLMEANVADIMKPDNVEAMKSIFVEACHRIDEISTSFKSDDDKLKTVRLIKRIINSPFLVEEPLLEINTLANKLALS